MRELKGMEQNADSAGGFGFDPQPYNKPTSLPDPSALKGALPKVALGIPPSTARETLMKNSQSKGTEVLLAVTSFWKETFLTRAEGMTFL